MPAVTRGTEALFKCIIFLELLAELKIQVIWIVYEIHPSYPYLENVQLNKRSVRYRNPRLGPRLVEDPRTLRRRRRLPR